jgi:signal transduction histidine kinase
MEPGTTNHSARRIAAFTAGLGLSLLYFIISDNQWPSNSEFHTIMEMSATVLALFIGILALVNYYSKKEGTILFIGTGFLGTAFLDGFHGIVTSEFFIPYMPSENTSRIPWSWLASRLFLSIYLFLSFLAWRREKKSVLAKPVSEKIVYISSITLTLASFILFAFVPLTEGFFSDSVFARPEEYFPAVFFALAIIGYIRKGQWKYSGFEFWLIMSLIIGFISQAIYMSNSANLFDLEFNMAHLLKITSYIFMLIGLLINMHNIYQQAEIANRTKSEFLNIISHELRTPLTVILGYTPLLSQPEKLPATKKMLDTLKEKGFEHQAIPDLLEKSLNEYSKFTNKMDASGKHLLSLINDMLDLSKIEANMMEIDQKVLTIRPIIIETCEQFEKSAKDKGLSLNYSSSDDQIYADERHMSQILINLIGNAIKFTDEGSINVAAVSKGDFVEFSITDTGHGINKDDIKNIFNPFTQVDGSATRNIGGSGLGLAITKRLIELHNGQISVNSELDQGTTFKFTIPRIVED